MWPKYPKDFTKRHEHPLHLRIWRAEGRGITRTLFDFHRDQFRNDSVAKAASPDAAEPLFGIFKYVAVEQDSYFFTEVVTFNFLPDYSTSLNNVHHRGQHPLPFLPTRCIMLHSDHKC
jgi:hypothetical protein